MNTSVFSSNDTYSVHNETDITDQNHNQSGKRSSVAKIKFNMPPFRIDSPRTKHAMKELGLIPSDLKYKTKDDLKKEGILDDVLEWRYNQYNAKIYKNIKELIEVRKRIMKETSKANLEISPQVTRTMPGNLDKKSLSTNKLIGGGIGPDAPNSAKDTHPQKYIKNTFALSSSPVKETPRTAPYSYTKALNYLRNSHETPDIKNVADLNITNPGETSIIEAEIARQVKDFNGLKEKKQKELVNILEKELKRIELINDMKEREAKLALKEKKKHEEMAKKISEKNYRYEEKIQRLKEIEEENIKKQLRLENQMKKKLENNAKKYHEEQEEKRKLLIAQEEKQKQKRQEIIERKAIREAIIDAGIEQTKKKISQKLIESQAKYEQTMNKKLHDIHNELIRASENSKRNKEKREEDEAIQVNKILTKIEEREEYLKKWQKIMYKNFFERKKEAEEREKRILENYKEGNQKQKAKTQELEEKLKKSMENVLLVKEQEEKLLKKRQEMNRIIALEHLENHKRYNRRLEYEQEKLVEKEKAENEKIYDIKSQKEFLLKARSEIAIQKKIEKDRLNLSMESVGKLVATNDDPLKPLQKVLREEDIKTLKSKMRKSLTVDQKTQNEANIESAKQQFSPSKRQKTSCLSRQSSSFVQKIGAIKVKQQ